MLFKIANELLDKKKIRILPEHDDSVKLANEFNKYYVEKKEKIREAIPITTVEVITRDLFVGEKLATFEPTNIKELTELVK